MSNPTCPHCRRSPTGVCRDCLAERGGDGDEWDDYQCVSCDEIRAMAPDSRCVYCQSDRYVVGDDGTPELIDDSAVAGIW